MEEDTAYHEQAHRNSHDVALLPLHDFLHKNYLTFNFVMRFVFVIGFTSLYAHYILRNPKMPKTVLYGVIPCQIRPFPLKQLLFTAAEAIGWAQLCK